MPLSCTATSLCTIRAIYSLSNAVGFIHLLSTPVPVAAFSNLHFLLLLCSSDVCCLGEGVKVGVRGGGGSGWVPRATALASWRGASTWLVHPTNWPRPQRPPIARGPFQSSLEKADLILSSSLQQLLSRQTASGPPGAHKPSHTEMRLCVDGCLELNLPLRVHTHFLAPGINTTYVFFPFRRDASRACNEVWSEHILF